MIERETDETERPRTPRAEEIRAAVAARLGIPISDIGAEDDLTELGLDSLGVMNLASTWQAAGVEVTFGELIEEATIAAWARLMDRSGSPDREAPEPADDEAFELAPMQHAYWSGRQPGMPLRTGSHFYFEFDTYLDPDRLDAAVSALRERHPMLRTGIDDDGVQHVHPARHGLDEVVDLRALDADTTEQRLARMRARMSHQTLRIAEGQGLDVRLVRLAEDACRLFLDIDMIVCDARSFGIVVSDLARLYAANSADTPPVDLDFRDYLRLVAQSGRGRRDRDAEYWRSRAESLPTAPSLPLATAPERLDEVASVRRHTWLSGDAYAQLAEHARAHGVTPSMALATAYADVLAAWSDDPHFLLNLPVFNRAPVHPDVEHLVGDFTDLQLLEVRPDGSLPFAERARAVQDQYRRDAAHSSYGGTSVLRDLARTTTGPGNRSGVVFTSVLGMGELFDRSALDLLGQPVWMSSQTPGVWIDLQLIEQDGGVLINWETAENLFSAGVPAAMFEAFAERARSLASDPDSWSRTLPVPLPVGQAEVRARVNDTGPGNPPRLLHPPIFTHAHTHPDRIAVHGHDHTLTYHQLTQQALAIAGHLRSRGIAHGDPVAVSIPKGPDQITAVLGILAAGACYVPIGIDQPPHRRNRILTSAHAHHALITTTPDPDWPHTTEPIDLTTATHAEPLPQPAQPSPHELAYIIYTSGSTGDPKGVEITHAAAANTIDAINHRYTIGPHDHVLAISALDFDLSVYDIFGLLTAGGHITTITENTRREPTHWAHLIQQHHITIWNTVPTLLDMLLTTTDTHQLPSLTLAMTSGDWIGLDLKDRLTTTAPNAHLAALGGATEAAIWSNVYDVTHIDPTWVSIPYGHPLPGQHYRVVNPHGHDCPDWVPGELWIGGAGLAHGYRNDPHKTNTSFITTNNQRWYRTGDQGRYHPDGTLEFLGRTDHQVKIRGHRIELGEIERALERAEPVREAVATVVPEPRDTLCAMLLGHDTVDNSPDEVLETAARHLPEFMVPAHVEFTDAFPLNANGKIDRAGVRADLAERLVARAEAEEAPDAELVGNEAVLASVWTELLDVRSPTRRSNFFHLGGDSLLATRMLAALRREGLSGSLGDLFSSPTIAGFASRLTSVDGSDSPTPTIVADLENRHEPFELTDVQRAYWLGRHTGFTLGGVGSYWYWEFESGSVDLDRLEDAWNSVVERHEMMRAVLDGDGRQRILASVPRFRFQVRHTTAADHDEAVAELRGMDSQILDVTTWPLFDVRAVQRDDGHTVLGIGFDYIVLDALSIVTVLSELSALYTDPNLHLPELELSYRDYLLATRTDDDVRRRDEAYWLRAIEELPPPPALPLRIAPEQVEQPSFVRRETRIGPERWQRLRGRAAEHGLTVSTVVATAFAEVLTVWSGEPELTLTLTVFDRQDLHPDVNRVVGDFTSLMLLAHRSRPDEPWARTVRRVQGQVWEGLEHNGVSSVWVLQQLAQRHGASQMLMPVVFTSTLGVSDEFPDLELSFGSQTRGLSQTPQVTLDCQVIEQDGGLTVNWDYVEGLFAPGVVADAADALRFLLEALVDQDWDVPPPHIPLPVGQAEVRARVNDTGPGNPPRLLHPPIFTHAHTHPDRIAVHGHDHTLTYHQLTQQALAIAGHLRSRGIAHGDPVAVSIPKGPDQITAVLGILAAGACYVPIGIDQPPHRRNRILTSAHAHHALITTTPDPDWPHTTEPIDLTTATHAEPLPQPAQPSPHELAYIIYTSGSTGDPKGVEITHAAAANTIDAINHRYTIGPHDHVLAISALDFDLSVYDIFGLLTAGGHITTITENTRREPTHWAHLIQQHHITIWNTVPTLLDMLLTTTDTHQLPSLTLAMTSGDWIGLDLKDRLTTTAPNAHLAALGGATEAAIWSNVYDVTHIDPTWVSIPYGHPLPGQHYRVVNPHGHDCPDWVPGELWIGGAGLAHGYRNDPHKTNTSFITTNNQRWYRTGDQGRYHPDGTLEFLGRTDHQVKIRGHRIELGEIETRLRELPDITHAAVWVEESGAAKRIAAAVAGTDSDAEKVRAELAGTVPDYMVPEHVQVLEAMPLNANGKIDRAALVRASPAITETPRREPVPPRTGTERAVAEIWQELLGVTEVSRDAGFFELGGDSLTATRVAQRLLRRFDVELTLRQLFDHPTLSQVAGLVDELILVTDDHDAPVRLEEGVL